MNHYSSDEETICPHCGQQMPVKTIVDDKERVVAKAAQEILRKYDASFWPGYGGCSTWSGPMDQQDQLRCLEILGLITQQSS